MRDILARPWLGYLVLGFSVTGMYYLVPAAGAGLALRVALYSLVSLSAAVMIVIGLTRSDGPQPLAPWLLMAVGQVVYALADVTFYVCHYLLGRNSFPALADFFYLSHYPLVVVGLISLIRWRTPGRDLPGLLDGGMLAVATALLSWLFLIGPQVRADLTPLVKVATLGYPIMDLMMFAVSLRLVFGQGRWSMSLTLLTGYLFAIFTADTLYSLQRLDGSYTAGNYLDFIWLTGNLMLGASALHPTARELGQRMAYAEVPCGRARMVAIAFAGLLIPTVLVIGYGEYNFIDIVVTAGAWFVIFILAIARMYALVVEQRRVAMTDELTGLYTRRYFHSRLTTVTASGRQPSGTVAVLMIDVDHFKSINDKYGHPAGDQALRDIATRFRVATRDEDLVARYGGEEFALVSTSVTVDTLPGVCERLRELVAGKPVRIDPHTTVTVTVSIGAAVFPLHATTPDGLVAVADQALYRAKACGRDRVIIGHSPVVRPCGSTVGSSTVGSLTVDNVPQDSVRLGASPQSKVDINPAPMVDFLRHAVEQVEACSLTWGHGNDVGRWARLVAGELGYDSDIALRVELAGQIHDVGKILISPSILAKPDALTDSEWRLVYQHPDQGARLVQLIPGFEEIADIIRQHHERCDGNGYPSRLVGPMISIEARILAVCDSWSAMRSHRPYRRAIAERDAREELRRGRDTQFDAHVVDAFLFLYECGRLGRLTDDTRELSI